MDLFYHLPEKMRLLRVNSVIRDFLFISLVVLLSIILYIRGLGFYTDDWDYLARFHTAPDQTFVGLFQAACGPGERMRPIQMLYMTTLYRAFGFEPLGYHLVNAGMILAGALMFYLVLGELGQARVLMLTIPIVYTLLPHASTSRFWYASSHANLSGVLFFLALRGFEG